MKRGFNILLQSIIFLVTLARISYSCDFCILSQGISPLETVQGAGIRINERYSLLNKVYKGTEQVTNPGAKEEYWTTEFTGFYAVTEDLTLLAVVPYKNTKLDGHIHIHEDGEVEAHPDKGDLSGFGDGSLLIRFTFFTIHKIDSTATIAGILGIKFPTGKTDGRTSDGEEFMDSHVQLGTGSTDYLIGFSTSHAIQRFSFSANLLGVITTEGKFGDTKHQFGNSLNYDVTAKYRVYPDLTAQTSYRIFLALGINGELREKEKTDSITDLDSGGNTNYLSPGFQIVAAPHWVFELAYHHAIYHNLYETQLGEDHKATGGVTYLF